MFISTVESAFQTQEDEVIDIRIDENNIELITKLSKGEVLPKYSKAISLHLDASIDNNILDIQDIIKIIGKYNNIIQLSFSICDIKEFNVEGTDFSVFKRLNALKISEYRDVPSLLVLPHSKLLSKLIENSLSLNLTFMCSELNKHTLDIIQDHIHILQGINFDRCLFDDPNEMEINSFESFLISLLNSTKKPESTLKFLTVYPDDEAHEDTASASIDLNKFFKAIDGSSSLEKIDIQYDLVFDKNFLDNLKEVLKKNKKLRHIDLRDLKDDKEKPNSTDFSYDQVKNLVEAVGGSQIEYFDLSLCFDINKAAKQFKEQFFQKYYEDTGMQCDIEQLGKIKDQEFHTNLRSMDSKLLNNTNLTHFHIKSLFFTFGNANPNELNGALDIRFTPEANETFNEVLGGCSSTDEKTYVYDKKGASELLAISNFNMMLRILNLLGKEIFEDQKLLSAINPRIIDKQLFSKAHLKLLSKIFSSSNSCKPYNKDKIKVLFLIYFGLSEIYYDYQANNYVIEIQNRFQIPGIDTNLSYKHELTGEEYIFISLLQPFSGIMFNTFGIYFIRHINRVINESIQLDPKNYFKIASNRIENFHSNFFDADSSMTQKLKLIHSILNPQLYREIDPEVEISLDVYDAIDYETIKNLSRVCKNLFGSMAGKFKVSLALETQCIIYGFATGINPRLLLKLLNSLDKDQSRRQPEKFAFLIYELIDGLDKQKLGKEILIKEILGKRKEKDGSSDEEKESKKNSTGAHRRIG